MNAQLDHAQQRTLQYWYIDGLAEIVLGGLSLLLAVYFFVELLIPQGTPISAIYGSSLVILVIGEVLAGRRLIEYAKQHITYPRTGFVAYPTKPPRRRWLAALMGGLIAMLVAYLMVRFPAAERWTTILPALIICLVMFIFALRSGLERLYLHALLAALLAVFIFLQGYALEVASVLTYGVMGAAFLLSGLLTLRNYLHTYARPTEES